MWIRRLTPWILMEFILLNTLRAQNSPVTEYTYLSPRVYCTVKKANRKIENCFELSTEKKTYLEAFDHCTNKGQILAEPKTTELNKVVQHLMKDNNIEWARIGATDCRKYTLKFHNRYGGATNRLFAWQSNGERISASISCNHPYLDFNGNLLRFHDKWPFWAYHEPNDGCPCVPHEMHFRRWPGGSIWEYCKDDRQVCHNWPPPTYRQYNEDCVSVRQVDNVDDSWYDQKCSLKLHFICQTNCFHESPENYQGKIHVTESGRECQRWDRQTPHSHRYRVKTWFSDGRMPENYCRQPVGNEWEHPRPWCFTTERYVRFEHCNIPKCKRACPNGFETYRTFCYKYVDMKETHYGAQKHCGIMNGILAEPRSAEENDVIKGILRPLGERDVWLGATDIDKENTFVWQSNGDELVWTDWVPNAPTNWDGNQDCLAYLRSYGWNDDNCDRALPFVCQPSTKAAEHKAQKKANSAQNQLHSLDSWMFVAVTSLHLVY